MQSPAPAALLNTGKAPVRSFIKPLSVAQFGALASTVLVFDQVTKWIAVRYLDGRPPHEVIPGFFQVALRHNPGAAWSILRDHPLPLMLFATAVALALLAWSLRLSPPEYGLRWATGLILGGAVGNLVDRYRLGHVIDFIEWHWEEVYYFPTFNVADSMICIGMGLLILMSLTTDAPSPGAPEGVPKA